MLQKLVPAPNSWPIAVAAEPPVALSVMLGSIAAMATPTWALAAWRFSSAILTSGRWRTRSAGSDTGTSRGSDRSARLSCGGWKSAGSRPGQRRQQVDLLRPLLLERGKRGARLHHHDLLRGKRRLADRAARELVLHQGAQLLRRRR